MRVGPSVPALPLLVSALMAMGMGVGAPPGGAQEAAPSRAVVAARRGGVVMVCRHAITGSFGEQEPVDHDDPSTQRRLSPEGEWQSRGMGRALRDLGVEVTELVASLMERARRTARLMFRDVPVAVDPDWHTNGGDYGGAPLERRPGPWRRRWSAASG